MVRVILYDHTFAFPRMIWYFALLCLMLINYDMSLIVGSILIIFSLYIFSALLFYLIIICYLNKKKVIQRYYAKLWYICFLFPIYNFVVFWLRFAGIINGINSNGAWKSKTPSEEKEAFCVVIKKDFSHLSELFGKLRRVMNNETNLK